MRELPPSDPFPVDALGAVLAPAARGIHDRVRAPLAICGQSVLGASTLTVQGHANVQLPTGHVKPLSEFFASIAASGERKSAVDHEALLPVCDREAELRKHYGTERLDYDNAKTAWEKAREAAVKVAKGDRFRIKQALDALGPAPPPPLEPLLTCAEPTYEGLVRLLAVGQPSIGVFSAEGGQFVGGHGMADDAKLRTAAGLSSLWDGDAIKRIRASDGITVLPGRRVAMHLMVQPDVAAIWFSDRLLLDQGFLSRVLVTAPEAASGTRMWRVSSPESDAALKRYGKRLQKILEMPLPLAEGMHNELAPRVLSLSPDARRLWIAFYDHIERRLSSGGELEPVRGLANKLPEHAARIAAVLALINDFEVSEITVDEMQAAIELTQHYVAEAMRLFGASRVSGELREAQFLKAWLETTWLNRETTSPAKDLISLPDIYQRGPNAIRDKAHAHRAVTILADHGWLAPADAGKIDGIMRRETWRIIKVMTP
jgi:hypothetical protein